MKKLIYLMLMLMLAACLPQEPVRIIITPTSPQNGAQTTIVAEVVPPATEVAPTATTIPPTATETLIPTLSGSEIPVVTALPTSTPLPVTNTAGDANPTEEGDFGAVIDDNYQLPPTSTPRPTETPTPVNTPFTTPQPVTSLDANMVGIQLDANKDRDAWFQWMIRSNQLGVKWIKVQVDWSALQPNGPADFGAAFRLFQLNVEDAHKQGFNVMLSIAKAPGWTRSNQNEAGPPDDPQSLGNFMAYLFTVIKPEWVDAVEVWNEPNLLREWTGTLSFDGAGYMQLFAPTYGAIKGVAPDVQIISAALAPTGSVPGITVDDRVFLQQMYDAGLQNYPDVVMGIHPYGWGNPPDAVCCDEDEDRFWDDDPHFFFLDTINAYRRIIAENGDAGRQMWITEFGWASWDNLPQPAPDVWMTYNSVQQQQDYTLRAFELIQAADDIGVAILWNLNFGNELLVANRVEMVGYSLFVDGYPIRPLYYALSEALRGEDAVRPEGQ
ncbi:MAG: hypothetical protein ACPG7F_04490 [Aggregatilineales bacterium]